MKLLILCAWAWIGVLVWCVVVGFMGLSKLEDHEPPDTCERFKHRAMNRDKKFSNQYRTYGGCS